MTKPLRPLSHAQLAAMGISVVAADSKAARKIVKGIPGSGTVEAPGYEVSEMFLFQSYLDSTLQERALLRQSPNEPIVKSTLSEPIQVNGYALALHPSSETPVAVQFETGGQQGKSQTYRIKPGQIIRPQGTDMNEDGSFSGFRWGLPFGWLGGGSATLVILRSPDSKVQWASECAEVVYHRIRLPIWVGNEATFPAAGGLYTGPLNWPQRFPWPAAVYGTDSLTQRGQPALAIQPTRTALALVNATGTLAAPSDVRIFFINADIWNILPNASPTFANVKFTDITWGSYAPYAAPPAPFSTAEPMQILTEELERIACNAGAVVCVADPAGDLATADTFFIDFVRFGKL